MKTKNCSSCKHDMPIDLFKFYDKYQSARVCNVCKDPDAFGYKYCPSCKEKKPLDRLEKRGDSTNRKYKARCRDCISDYQREYRAQTRYGLSHTELVQIRESQENRCTICNQELELVADHCHESGKFRSFLCDKCNRGLGYFDDLSDRLFAAARYLKEHGR